MKPPVKTLAFCTISLLSLITTKAQIKPASTGSIAAEVKQIISDYPNKFSNLLGSLIIENPQSADYECTVKVTGAEESIITKYSGKSNSVSWHAIMFSTEDFAEAKRQYNSIYNQVKSLSIKSNHLKGIYEVPTEEKKFTSVLLSFDASDASLDKLKVEVVLEAEQMAWRVKILVYDRDRMDDEQGDVKEN